MFGGRLLAGEEYGLVVGEVHPQELLLLQRLHQRRLVGVPGLEFALGQRHLGAGELVQQLGAPGGVAAVHLKKVGLSGNNQVSSLK